MRVSCDIEQVELENDDGRPVDGVQATCIRCEHQTESYGTSSNSVRRCLVMMREECPQDESNFYFAEGGGTMADGRSERTVSGKVESDAAILIEAHHGFMHQADDVVLRQEPWTSEAWWRALVLAAIEECKR